MQESDLAEGTRLGRYTLGRELGRGGAGTVFEATLHGPGGFRRQVALKVLRDRQAGSVDRLLDEARLGALVQHPNLVPTWEVGQIDGLWFLAMELVRGPTIARLLYTGPLSTRAVLEVARQVCSGLTHLHHLRLEGRTGVVHRDVKPSNLFVDPWGTVKVGDLGIAGIAGASRGWGTAGYAAPEQLEGHHDARADVFAMGATVYAMVLRAPPFGKGPAATAEARRVEEHLARPDFLGPLDQALPGLGGVVARCLRLRPADRWGSVEELSTALGGLRGVGLPLLDHLRTVTPSPPPERSLRPEPPEVVGRARELARLATEVARPGLVTLTGLGGMGKTCLATDVSRRLSDTLPGGTVFVDLTAVETRGGLVDALGSRLGAVGSDDAETRIRRALAARGRCLLVLDNFEQLVDATEVLAALRTSAPEATLLVTSRRVLRVSGERSVELGAMREADAVALFRARAHLPEDTDPQRIVEVVNLLDRHPLSLTLAAGRTRRLPLSAIARGLEDRLRLLASTERDRTDRHRSLRHSLDASYDLLTEPEQAAFRQLSVFRGPATLAALEGVLDVPGAWPLDLVEALSDHHLLERVDDRFHLLPLVRDYASQRCSPAEAVAAGERHAAWFAQFGSDDWARAIHRHGAVEVRAELRANLPDFLLGCRTALALGRLDLAQSNFDAAHLFRDELPPPVLRSLCEALAATGSRELSLVARAAHLNADRRSGRPGLVERAESLLQELEGAPASWRTILRVRGACAVVFYGAGRRTQSAEQHRRLANGWRTRHDETELAAQLALEGQALEAPDFHARLLRCERLYRERGDVWGLIGVLAGLFAIADQDPRPAVDLVRESIALSRQWHGRDVPSLLVDLGWVLGTEGSFPAALEALDRAVDELGREGARGPTWCTALLRRAHLHRRLGRDETADLSAVLEEARKTGNAWFRAAALHALAQRAWDRDEPDAVRSFAVELQGMDETTFATAGRGWVAAAAAWAAAGDGALAEAARWSLEPEGSPFQALLALLGDDLDTAERRAREGLTQADPIDRLEAWVVLASALRRADRPEEALEAFPGGADGPLPTALRVAVRTERSALLALSGREVEALAELADARAPGALVDDYSAFRLAATAALVHADARRDPELDRATRLATTWRRRRELFLSGLGPEAPLIDPRTPGRS